MPDRKDRRPIPAPPGHKPVDGADGELEAAFGDFDADDQRATAKQKREEFAAARKRLVDFYVEASNGAVDHLAFNGVPVDQFDDIAAEHGFQSFHRIADENRSLREAIGAEIAGKHRHVDLGDLGEVLDPGRPFDLEQVTARAAEVDAQRSEQARELLTGALADLGVELGEGDDPIELLRRAGEAPKQSADPEMPEGHYISTPQSRSASLPTGRFTDADAMLRSLSDDGRTGTAAIEAAAAEDITSGKLRI